MLLQVVLPPQPQLLRLLLLMQLRLAPWGRTAEWCRRMGTSWGSGARARYG